MWISAGVLALLLSGCSASTTAPTSSTHPSPKPTRTAAVLTAPRAALPSTCAELLPLPTVQSHLIDPVSIRVDETHLPPLLDDLALVAAGGTECVWGGENRTDATYDTGVTLKILPDAATAFAAWEASPSIGGAVRNTIGQGSSYDCFDASGSGGDWCGGDALMSGYWVSFVVNDISGSGGDTVVASMLAPVATAVAAAGPARANWAPPASTTDIARWCSAPDAAARIGAVTGTAMTLTDYEPRTGIDGLAADRARTSGCIWASVDQGYFSVVNLPAGAWAIPVLVSNPPNWTLIGQPTSLQLTASTGAVRGCGEHCEAMIGIGTDLVDISQSGNEDVSPGFDATAQRLVDSATS
jgi:hypothetical protein